MEWTSHSNAKRNVCPWKCCRFLHAGVVATWMIINKFGDIVHLGHPCPTVSSPTQASSTYSTTRRYDRTRRPCHRRLSRRPPSGCAWPPRRGCRNASMGCRAPPVASPRLGRNAQRVRTVRRWVPRNAARRKQPGRWRNETWRACGGRKCRALSDVSPNPAHVGTRARSHTSTEVPPSPGTLLPC